MLVRIKRALRHCIHLPFDEILDEAWYRRSLRGLRYGPKMLHWYPLKEKPNINSSYWRIRYMGQAEGGIRQTCQRIGSYSTAWLWLIQDSLEQLLVRGEISNMACLLPSDKCKQFFSIYDICAKDRSWDNGAWNENDPKVSTYLIEEKNFTSKC